MRNQHGTMVVPSEGVWATTLRTEGKTSTNQQVEKDTASHAE